MCFPIPGGAPPLACCSHNFLNWQSKASELRFSGSSGVFCFQGGKVPASRRKEPEGGPRRVAPRSVEHPMVGARHFAFLLLPPKVQ